MRKASATKDGLPRSAFAYAPTADPATWKLPYKAADGSPDLELLPVAAASITEASVPDEFVPMVKAKLRSAYRRAMGSDVVYPEGIAESEENEAEDRRLQESDDMSFSDITSLLSDALRASSPSYGKDGNYCYPEAVYDGWLVTREESPTDSGYYKRSWAIVDGEVTLGEPVEVVRKSTWAKVAESDIAEAGFPAEVTDWFTEVGKRNSANDAKRIQGVHDFVVELGADCAYGMKEAKGDQPKMVWGKPNPAYGGGATKADVDKELEAIRKRGKAAGFKADDDDVRATFRRNKARRDKRLALKRKADVKEAAADGYLEEIMAGTGGTPFEDDGGLDDEETIVESGGPIVREVTKYPQPAEPVTVRESAGEGGDALVTLAEAGAVFDRENRVITITPIRPGFGNKKDGFFYPAETLKEATEAGMFNHLKMFRNHPRKSDRTDLPERSVTDWFATTQEATWDAEREIPRLPIKVHDDADFRRFEDAPEQIAFSVLGGGKARPGKVDGQEARIVESFVNLRSVDWVTTAGAGGAIDFAESATEELEMEFTELTMEKLAEARPDLIKAIREADEEAAKPDADEKPDADKGTADADTGPTTIIVDTPAGAAGDAAPEKPAPEGFVSRAEFDALKREMAKPAAVKEAASVVAATVAESTLPGTAKAAVVEMFAESAIGFDYDDEASLKKAVTSQLAMAEKLLGAKKGETKGTGAIGGPADGADGESVREAAAARIDARWGTESVPKPRPHTFEADGVAAIGESATTPSDGKTAEDRIADRLR